MRNVLIIDVLREKIYLDLEDQRRGSISYLNAIVFIVDVINSSANGL